MTGLEKDYPSPSLEEVHRTVKIPARWWRRMLAFTVELQSAPRLLQGILGSRIAPIAFAVAMICTGQSSTVTGTLAVR